MTGTAARTSEPPPAPAITNLSPRISRISAGRACAVMTPDVAGAVILLRPHVPPPSGCRRYRKDTSQRQLKKRRHNVFSP
eukprot:2506095-Prymnesium_polylepis.1